MVKPALLPDSELWAYLQPRMSLNNDWDELLKDGVFVDRASNLIKIEIRRLNALIQGNRSRVHDRIEVGRFKGDTQAWLRLCEFRLLQLAPLAQARRREINERTSALRGDTLRLTLRQLVIAIGDHRAAITAANIEQSPADLKLWTALDAILPSDAPGAAPTLLDMYENHWSTQAQDRKAQQ